MVQSIHSVRTNYTGKKTVKTNTVSNPNKGQIIFDPSFNPEQDKIKKQVQKNVKDDLGNEILQKDDKYISGVRVKKGDVYFDYNRYKEITGKDITLGELKKRYNIPDGVLKEANNIRFGGSMTPGMIEGKGANLNKYTPSELGLNFVKIPREYLDEYLKD